MQADGKGWLYAPSGLLDGPMPAHYEPHESPVRNPLYHQQANPTREVFKRKDNLSNPSAGTPGADVFPYVFTTYRLTEHHTAGGMSRWLPLLSRAAAGVLLRGVAGAGEGARPRAPGLGDARQRPDGDRGAGHGHRPRRAAEGRRQGHPPDRPALPLGRRRRRRRQRRLRQRPVRAGARRATCTSRSRRSRPATSSPGARPRGEALLRLVEEYRSRAGITVETGNTKLTPGVRAPEGAQQ